MKTAKHQLGKKNEEIAEKFQGLGFKVRTHHFVFDSPQCKKLIDEKDVPCCNNSCAVVISKKKNYNKHTKSYHKNSKSYELSDPFIVLKHKENKKKDAICVFLSSPECSYIKSIEHDPDFMFARNAIGFTAVELYNEDDGTSLYGFSIASKSEQGYFKAKGRYLAMKDLLNNVLKIGTEWLS
jgi:hypothetical protein